jgi:hypothetical protein
MCYDERSRDASASEHPLRHRTLSEKVARRLRTLNIGTWIAAATHDFYAIVLFFEPVQTFDRGTRTFSTIGFQAESAQSRRIPVQRVVARRQRGTECLVNTLKVN